MTKHDPKLAQEAQAPQASEEPQASAAPPRLQVTLIGGVADGRRIPKPDGTAAIVRAGAAQETYILSRAFLAAGQPVEFWHARFLPPAEALARAAISGSGPLSADLHALGAAARLGDGRAEGLDRLRRRLPVPEVRALAAAVLRCERHGVPLGPEVAALAAAARAERSRRVRDRAQRAAPKIQLVVALLLVPAVLLLVAAGLLAGLR